MKTAKKEIDKIEKQNAKDQALLKQDPITVLKNLENKLENEQINIVMSNEKPMTKKEKAAWDRCIQTVQVEIFKLENIESLSGMFDDTLNKIESNTKTHINQNDIILAWETVGDFDYDFNEQIPQQQYPKFYKKSGVKSNYYDDLAERFFEELSIDDSNKIVLYETDELICGVAVIDFHNKILINEVLE